MAKARSHLGLISALRRWAIRLGYGVVLLLAACATQGGEHATAQSPQQAQAGAAATMASWNDGPSRRAIEAFVRAVTDPGSPDFVPVEQRIAVFDNDGTLWSEKPVYFQVLYALDRIQASAPRHPEWKTRQPYKTVLEKGAAALAELNTQDLMQIIAVTQTGMDTETYRQQVRDWTATARHPRFQQPYTSLAYAPMRELLDYLRAHDFKTYIVSGGEVEFIRAWAQQAYGIPPEQVIGSRFVTSYDVSTGEPRLMRQAKLEFNDDGVGKPVAIQQVIGRRPILAFGNSDGDLQMLLWTASGPGRRFAGLVHHTDAQREWAYDRDSKVGRLDQAWDEARRRNWTIVDMEKEWSRVYAY